MIDIKAKIVGSELVQAKLTAARGGYSLRLAKKVRALGIELQRRVKEVYLTGKALNVGKGKNLGGRLRHSVTESFAADGSTFTSSVGTNVAYGRFWELGFDRRVGAGARGGQFAAMKEAARAKYFAKHPSGVKHYDARPFLAPSLADMKDKIRNELKDAIEGN